MGDSPSKGQNEADQIEPDQIEAGQNEADQNEADRQAVAIGADRPAEHRLAAAELSEAIAQAAASGAGQTTSSNGGEEAAAATLMASSSLQGAAIAGGDDIQPADLVVPVAASNIARTAKKSAVSVEAAPLKKTDTATSDLPDPTAPINSPAVPDQPSIAPSKETNMSETTTDFTQPMNEVATDMQDRSNAAYAKSSEMMTDMTEAAKGNVEAVVESGKIFSNGMQELARTYVEDAKSAYEQMTADLKEMAAVKSPTELLQIQGKIMRRNFDAVVASTSKNTEKMMKLSNESFAPLTARLSMATDKIAKA